MKRLVALAALALCLGGCKAPFVWSDPSVQAVSCGITSAVLPLLESLAVTIGVPLSVVEKLYADSCSFAAAHGLDQKASEKYGLEHARLHAMAMKASGEIPQ